MNCYMSNPARDMFLIATRIAGFDEMAMHKEMFQIQRNKAARINLPTVLEAMDRLYIRQHGAYPTKEHGQ